MRLYNMAGPSTRFKCRRVGIGGAGITKNVERWLISLTAVIRPKKLSSQSVGQSHSAVAVYNRIFMVVFFNLTMIRQS